MHKICHSLNLSLITYGDMNKKFLFSFFDYVILKLFKINEKNLNLGYLRW